MKLGIVIPAYRESENIARLVRQLHDLEIKPEILVVDDSPDDLSVKAIESLGLASARILHRQGKGGRGSAVLDGMKALLEKGCDWVLEMDADFSHPPAQIPDLLQEAQTRGLDLLIASRYLGTSRIENWPLQRRVFSRCSNLLARTLLQVPVRDYTNGFRLYSRRAAEEVVRTCGRYGKGFIALSEILVNLFYRGYAVGEVPTVFVNRVRGESSLSRNEIASALTGLVQIWKLKREIQIPPSPRS